MENKRVLRSSNRIPRPNSNNVANNKKTTLAAAAAKRKMSESENSLHQTQPAKRAALGDLTNKKAPGTKKGKQTEKRSLRSMTDSDTCSISSQEISLSSQKSLTRQSSKDSRTDVQTLNELNSQLSGTSSTLSGSAAVISAGGKQQREPHRVDPALLHIPAPPTAHGRTDLQYQDIDKENELDTFQSPEYAQDIFNYYKSKEAECMVDDYITRQTDVTPNMRAVLVDWMVEVQENFELNHETLYLAVRLTDHYLMKKNVSKDALQLVGAAAIFIGCKFDERIPPMVDDFLYICDDAYNRMEFVRMEKDILRTVDFNLGMPISYRFLRRLAKAGKKTMACLTLARYINETALMSYKIVTQKESLIAAGCLRLAMLMSHPDHSWNDTLIHYSGYEESEVKPMVSLLNSIMHNKNQSLKTVSNKYSHAVFFEVAKKPLIPMGQLFKDETKTESKVTTTHV